MTLLAVENLTVSLDTDRGPARAVRDISFGLDRGATLGIVGESGCGKTMTALALMGLLPEGTKASGKVKLDGRDILDLSEREMRRVRGKRIAMVFQEPMTSLNPLYPIGRQVTEAAALERGLSRRAARAEAVRLLDLVGIADPASRLSSYPHQLSGGQRQRVMIAMALSCGPEILIADEPTTALDAIIQKQILELIARLVADLGMAMILISHDLGVIARNVDRIIVMYGGAAVERGPTETLLRDFSHPYTQGLFAAAPLLSRRSTATPRRRRLPTIGGTVPQLVDLPPGCTFADRCALATQECRSSPPAEVEVGPHHVAACIHLEAARARRVVDR